MNYIAMLREQSAQAARRAQKAMEEVTDLRAYLQSPKFHDDPTVQVADVLHRLQYIADAITCD
jgi:hypothetical protein